jgi:hypothetical protein
MRRGYESQNLSDRTVKRLAQSFGGVEADGAWKFPSPEQATAFQKAFKDEQKARHKAAQPAQEG